MLGSSVLFYLASTIGVASFGDEAAALQARPPAQKMIVLSHGRGGSTVLAQTIAQLSNSSHSRVKNELFGENAREMATVVDPVQRMANWFASQQADSPDSAIVGFKWKPVYRSQALDDAWDWVAHHNVRVLWLTRNLLDVIISESKHMSDPSLTSHCDPNDSECIRAHEDLRVRLDANRLVHFLGNETHHLAELAAMLDAKHVSYRHLSFETLFGGSGATTAFDPDHALVVWNDALTFLGQATATNYADVEQAIQHTGLTSTAARTQCDSLLNAAEVRMTLLGTQFEPLLTCQPEMYL